jgi:hypothetical protein
MLSPILRTLILPIMSILTRPTPCYEENISMASGKLQQTEITIEINSNLRYAI